MKRKNNIKKLKKKIISSLGNYSPVKIIITVIAIIFLAKVLPGFLPQATTNKIVQFITRVTPTPTPIVPPSADEIKRAVFPDKLDLGVSFGDTIVKMIEGGAIDKDKFLALYANRGGLKPEEKSLLETPATHSIVVTEQNAGLILNFLWPLGISNRTNVLSEGPMGTEYKKDVGNFASTGGWTVGKRSGGQLYNSLLLIPLTPEQETLVREVARNIYRPCCGNSTYFPDCNHGAAMLGFIELAVSSGMSKEEIYKKALVLNSYWFPTTYADLYVYFTRKKGVPWERVDAKEVLGENFSGGRGYAVVSKELQEKGLLPKIQGGGGGCGV